MGYSVYWNQHRSFTNNEWVKIVNHFNTNLNNECVDVESITPFEGEIFFNGANGETCETFCLSKNPTSDFHFCKTQELPYDKVIWKLLKFVKEEVVGLKNPDFEISNDNGEVIV